ncbi:MAG: hypothetical protein ACREBI_05185 [Nitrosotalea sp.]
MSLVGRSRGNKSDLQSISERKIAIRQILDRLGQDHVIDKGFVLQELAKDGFNPSIRTLERDLVEIHRRYRLGKKVRLAYKKEIDYCYRLVRLISHECDMIFAQSKKIKPVTSVTIGPRVVKIIEEYDRQRVAKITIGAMEIDAQVAGMMINMIVRAAKGRSVKMYRVALTRKYLKVKGKRIKLQSLVKPFLLKNILSEQLFKKTSKKKPRQRKKKIHVSIA